MYDIAAMLDNLESEICGEDKIYFGYKSGSGSAFKAQFLGRLEVPSPTYPEPKEFCPLHRVPSSDNQAV